MGKYCTERSSSIKQRYWIGYCITPNFCEHFISAQIHEIQYMQKFSSTVNSRKFSLAKMIVYTGFN